MLYDSADSVTVRFWDVCGGRVYSGNKVALCKQRGLQMQFSHLRQWSVVNEVIYSYF